MTEAQFNSKLSDISKITNPDTKAYRLDALTQAYYELPTLDGSRGDTMQGDRMSIHDDALGAEYGALYGVSASGVDDVYTPETPVEPMVAQGANVAWLDAITLAEINASVEGVQRTHDVRTARNTSATKYRTRSVRAKQADANKARIKKRQKVQAKKVPKAKQRRAVAVPPSQR